MAGRRLRLSKLYSLSCVGPSVVGESETLVEAQGAGFSRLVFFNQPDKHKVKPFRYRSNYVSTTKYTLLTFFPKALFEQFRRVANLYFLFAAALSLTPLAPFTASSLIAPLVFVVGVSMIKEGVEDWRRFMQDQEVNKRTVLVHVGQGCFRPKQWKQLRVGDVVKVSKDSFFPADLLLLSSSFPDGICYVETSNLDGETNLKIKKCVERTLELNEDGEFAHFVAQVRCEDPNPNLYTFVGNLDLGGGHDIVPLSAQQLLLRDSKLRNTEHVYGVVIFSGHDTKVMQNAREAPSKRSRIERKMDKIIYFLFTALLVISVFGSVAFGVRTKNDMPRWWYLKPRDADVYYSPDRAEVAALLHLITALILYGYLIPISLYVSIEIVKVLQALFINNDIAMYDEVSDTPAHARTSNLNEELGQVDTILSDKTGTLTCNVMEFRKCSIAGVSYGRGITEVERATAKRLGKELPDNFHDVTPPDASPGPSGMIEMSDVPPRVKGFNFTDERLMDTNWLRQSNANVIRMFFRILAVCHTVIPEENMDQISYQAEAPDELAFVVAAREFGFEFYKRTQTSIFVWEPDESGNRQLREYKLLNLLEFNSTRKRMSVVVRDESNDIYIFSKGADSVMLERLSKNGRQFEAPTRAHLSEYAEAGLRTLVLAYRKIEEAEYKEWNATFLKAKTTIGANRDELLERACELIEKDLILVGATAVEDKLQKGVPECIDRLAQAGLKIWVLTGDKLETAINIGFACSLLRQGMKQIVITLDNGDVKLSEQFGNKEAIAKASMESISQQLANALQQIELETDEDAAFALIIDGKALAYALEDALKEKLLRLAINCASVICCRVSPKQKALVTKLVKEGTGRTTLSIGDGANDVGMIQEADIGVGISGLEGMQAVMASDFSIAQFRFLERLLIVHGHWCYKRIAQMICYFFYKNITFGMTLFYFEAFTSFSGQTAYNDWYMSLFNVFFTSLPVIALGVFEQDVSARVCLMFPTLYQQGPRNLFFSWSRILGWMANGVYSSLVTFFFVTCIFEHQAYRKGGQNSELAILGASMYTCVVWAVNCQVALAISYFTWIQHFVIWGSVGMWYIFLLVYGAITPVYSTTAYQVLIEALGPAPYYWLTTLLVTLACVLPYFVYMSFQRTFWPMDHHIIQEIRHLQRDYTDPEMWLRERAKAIERTSIGLSARVEARIRHMRNSRLSPRR